MRENSSTIDIFQIKNSNQYDCAVWSYRKSHSLMLVRAVNDDLSIYLTFENVRYYCGPLIWSGVDGYLGTQNEVESLIGINGPFSKKLQLFIFPNEPPVKIVAENIYRSEEIPPNFFWLNE